MINLIKKLWNNRAMRYLFFGVLSTLVNLIIFNGLVYIGHMNYTLSNIISVACAIVFAFFVNKLFVFMSSCNSFHEVWVEFYRFVIGRLSTLVIEVGGVSLCVEIIHQSKWLAKLETQFIVVVVNYFISKFLVFKATDQQDEEEEQS